MKKICISLMLCSIAAQANFFTSTYETLFKTWMEESQTIEYELHDEDTLIVEMHTGRLEIKQSDDTKLITGILQKKAPHQEYISAIALKKNQESPNSLKISVTHIQPNIKGKSHLILHVPKHLTLALSNQQGTIDVAEVNGNVTAHVQQGAITIKETSGAIIASTKHGSISINNPGGNVKANTHQGTISIQGARQSVAAQSTRGAIDVACKELPSQGTIMLQSKSGSITLALPEKINADFSAATQKGQLTCEHYITTKPQTIQLNKKTWKRFQREASGILGSGEATIRLSSTNSSIKVLNTSLKNVVA